MMADGGIALAGDEGVSFKARPPDFQVRPSHRRPVLCNPYAALFADFASGIALLGIAGTRILVPQLRHRTVFPRQLFGTSSTFRHVRFGHMILMLGDSCSGMKPSCVKTMDVSAI